jgi:hypothetical protein
MAKMKTHEQFCKEVYDKYNTEYEVIGRYSGNKNKIEIIKLMINFVMKFIILL